MNAIRKYGLFHILFWLTLFAVWHFFRYQDYDRTVGLQITAVKVADLALLVYITNYVLIPRLLYKKKYWQFGIIFLLMVVTSSTIKMYILGQLLKLPNIFSFAGGLKERFYDNVLPHILLVSTGAAFKLLLDQVRAQRKLVTLAKEKADAELNFLKSQINPHFLFNSLNSVYFLIDKENTEARRTLLQFSDLLRYQLYDCNADKIGIEKEIEFLRDYIHLQELRRDNHYKISVSVGQQVKGFSITPLLLIPFVENAFKHISNHSDRDNYVDVSIDRMNGSLFFSVTNSKENNARSTEPVGGIGLNNVKRRLELLYPGKHELKIGGSEDQFKVDLKLDFKN